MLKRRVHAVLVILKPSGEIDIIKAESARQLAKKYPAESASQPPIKVSGGITQPASKLSGGISQPATKSTRRLAESATYKCYVVMSLTHLYKFNETSKLWIAVRV